jgi:hypothetical protein
MLAKPFQKLEGCRRTAFEKLDQPVLRALPPLSVMEGCKPTRI